MTTQDGHRLCSLLIRMCPLRSSLNSVKKVQNEKGVCIISIRSDHGCERLRGRLYRVQCNWQLNKLILLSTDVSGTFPVPSNVAALICVEGYT